MKDRVKMFLEVDAFAQAIRADEYVLGRLDELHDPLLIFMDINMPEMDGYTATEAIRGMKAPKSKIPIIALTADAMKEDKERCLQVGMNDHISKPFRLEEIGVVLKKFNRAG